MDWVVVDVDEVEEAALGDMTRERREKERGTGLIVCFCRGNYLMRTTTGQMEAHDRSGSVRDLGGRRIFPSPVAHKIESKKGQIKLLARRSWIQSNSSRVAIPTQGQ